MTHDDDQTTSVAPEGERVEEIERIAEEIVRIAEERPAELGAYLQGLPDGDAARAISRVPPEPRAAVIGKLEPESAAGIVEQVPYVQAVELFEHVEHDTAAAILGALPSADQADLLSDLSDEDAEAILRRMDPAEAEDARVLAAYADDVAGGLMITEVLAYPESHTVADVIEDLRVHQDEYRDYVVQYAYVTSEDGALLGVLRLRDLLLAPRSERIAKIRIPDPLSVEDTTTLDDLSELFDRHHFFGVPVVDAERKLLGVVQASAVEEALGERSDSDYLKSQGIVGGEEIREMPLLRRSRRRLAWLSINIVLNIVAASVIAVYQDTLSAVIALAVFLPIISDMSGCSGNQAVAVSMRELALGLVRPSEILRVWLKEMSVGAINGVVLGLLIGAVAWLWKGNPVLGAVVGGALFLNTMVAVSIGGVVPLVLKRFGMDPALASGPILTTITDMCGFFLVLTFASSVLSQLT